MKTQTQTYGGQLFITNELRENTAISIEGTIRLRMIRQLQSDGYEAVDQPTYEWHRFTEIDIMLDPDLPVGVGDWRLRATVRAIRTAE